MGIVAKFFPNGEFSHGVDTSQRRRDRRRDDANADIPLNLERRDEYLRWIENAEIQKAVSSASAPSEWVSSTGRVYTLIQLSVDSCSLAWFDDTKDNLYTSEFPRPFRSIAFEFGLTPLVYQTVESSQESKSRKKLDSMTRSMGRNIRNAVYLLEQMPGGKDVLSFLTLTLPDLSSDGLAICCKNWLAMTDQFLKWLRDRLETKGIEFYYVYCTEIQPKRLQSRSEYAPHLHIVFRGRGGRKLPWAITPKQARKAWARCISKFVSESFTSTALENIQRIKYSAARYLAKYLSKGKCRLPQTPEASSISQLKTQWGGMCRLLSRRIREFTTVLGESRVSSNSLLAFVRAIPRFIELRIINYYKPGFITLGYDEVSGLEYGLHVGCGCLSTPTYEGGALPIIEFVYGICSDV
jgi:hypothetical protein